MCKSCKRNLSKEFLLVKELALFLSKEEKRSYAVVTNVGLASPFAIPIEEIEQGVTIFEIINYKEESDE